jgi:hypothetical protein
MPRCPAQLVALLVLLVPLLLAGCSGSSTGAPEVAASAAEPAEPATPAAVLPECSVQLRVASSDGPMAGQQLELLAMQQVDERAWSAIAKLSVTTDTEGFAQALLPCDTRLSLRSSGWMWANQPDRLVLRESMAPIEIVLLPELTLRLFVHGGKGPAAQDVRFHRKGDEVGQPVPREGLVIPGLRMSEVAGEIRSANLPPRQWRPSRSDEIEQISPGMHEAVVIVGDIRQSWLELSPDLRGAIDGALCIVDGQRGDRCIFHQGVWRCPCPPGASIGLYGSRWDVAVVRRLDGPDLLLETLPEAEQLCLRFPEVRAAGAMVITQPAGVSGGLLLGGLPRPLAPGGEVCLRLARGEATDVGLQGSASGTWTVVSEGQASVELHLP